MSPGSGGHRTAFQTCCVSGFSPLWISPWTCVRPRPFGGGPADSGLFERACV